MIKLSLSGREWNKLISTLVWNDRPCEHDVGLTSLCENIYNTYNGMQIGPLQLEVPEALWKSGISAKILWFLMLRDAWMFYRLFQGYSLQNVFETKWNVFKTKCKRACPVSTAPSRETTGRVNMRAPEVFMHLWRWCVLFVADFTVRRRQRRSDKILGLVIQ